MDKNQNAQIAFRMWEKMAQREEILCKRYYEEFLDLILDQENAKSLEDDENNWIDTWINSSE